MLTLAAACWTVTSVGLLATFKHRLVRLAALAAALLALRASVVESGTTRGVLVWLVFVMAAASVFVLVPARRTNLRWEPALTGIVAVIATGVSGIQP